MLRNISKRYFSSNVELYKNYLNDNTKKLVIATGPAGTGKTMLACEAAISQFKNNKVKKIIITRPLISADNDIGYLPGTLENKMEPWMRPILDVFHENYSKTTIEKYIKNGLIEISPLMYMRGRTFKDSFIIGDECQNTNISQMKMLLTRIGDNSKMVVNGDLDQVDLEKNIKSGLSHFISLLNQKNYEESIGLIKLDQFDIKRSEIVSKIIDLYKY